MLYQYTKRYLKKKYTTPSTELNWSMLDNLEYLSYVDDRYTREELSKEVSEVKEAFKDFFEPVGKIVFRYKEESGVKFKVFPYRVQAKDSQHLKSIVRIIQNNTKYIKHPYQGQMDQIAILGKIRRDVNREVHDTQESINVKELIEYAIRVTLELGDNDLVTQLRRKYIVKIFEKNKVVPVKPDVISNRKDVTSRYNGYTEEEIKETCKDIFNKANTSVDTFLKQTMKNLLVSGLNFRKIENKFYEENGLKVIQNAVQDELKNYTELENDYLRGVSGYIMRKNFLKIHELMAINLIESIYDKDENANRFLLYYDGSTVLIDNKKHIIPSLETQDGQKWNNASLIGICNLWMNTKRKKERYEHKLSDISSKIHELEKALVHVQPEIETQQKSIQTAQVKLDKAEKIHKEIDAKLQYLEKTNLNSNEYFSVLEKHKKSQEQVQGVKEEKKTAKGKLAAIKDVNSESYSELEFFVGQKEQILHDLRAQDLNIDSKNSQIDPIIDSVAKVLMTRTKAV